MNNNKQIKNPPPFWLNKIWLHAKKKINKYVCWKNMQLFNTLLLHDRQMFTLFSIFIRKNKIKIFSSIQMILHYNQNVKSSIYRQKKGWWVYSLSIGNNLSQISNLSLFKPFSTSNEFPMLRKYSFSVLYCSQVVVLVISSSGSLGFLEQKKWFS